MKNIRNWLYYLGAFFINALLISIIFAISGMAPFGHSSFLTSDLGTQYIMFLTEFRRQLTQGNVHLYLFSLSLGDNFFPILSYYLLSPFNVILTFFSAGNVPVAANVIIMAKISTMGITMAYFLKKYFNNNSYFNYLFTVAYSFCGFVATYFYDLMWLDALIMLPLIAVALLNLVKHDKFIMYYVVLLVSIIVNYYLGYMLCIFSLCFFIYLFIENNVWKSDRRKKVIRNFAVTSILSGLSSAVILVPTLFGMMKTAKGTFNIGYYLPTPRFGLEALTQFGIGANNFNQRLVHGPAIFMTSTVLILVIAYFFSNNIEAKDKKNSFILIFFLFITMIVTIFNTIWHMFQNPAGFPFRDSFIFSFICIFIAYKSFNAGVYKEKEAILRASVIAVLALLVGYAVELAIPKLLTKMYFISEGNSNHIRYLILSLITFILSGFLIYLIGKNKKFGYLLFAVIAFEVIANFNSVLGTAPLGNQTEYSNAFKKEAKYFQSIEKQRSTAQRTMITQSGLNEVFTENYNNYNDPIMFNVNGISLYSSTLNQDTMEFLNNLGFFSKNVRRIGNRGGTKFSTSILGIHDRVTVKKGKQVLINNPYSPGLGYLVDSKIKDYKMSKGKPFNNQNSLYQHMTGNKDTLFSSAIMTNYQQNKSHGKNNFTYEITPQDDGPLYFYRKPLSYVGTSITVNGKRVGKGSLMNKATIIYLGKFKADEKVKIKIRTKYSLFADPTYFQTLDMNKFSQFADTLKNNSLDVQSDLNHDKIAGTITADKDSTLLVSVPYDKGWSAYDNGKKVPVQKSADSLSSIDISKGKHNISFNYSVPGLKLGWLVSLISLILFIGYAIFIKFLKKGPNNA
ncbi:YfhO family protein [Companilactobacillus metriopterae]|uniref:YfhO family protein n=1 Tax=Companilactobacillus metriopterae TaxID=1909267 RepID=UPI00100B6286|nr:YfhO family protein [Companilactobacillus metriopterae]